MIPEGHTIEDIKKREQIIRDFYREWKEKNPSQRKFNLSWKEYINIRMVSVRRQTLEKVQYCITAISSE